MGGFFILHDSLSAGIDALVQNDDTSEVEHIAQSLLDDAKANAPWADRTGAARDGLDVEVESGDGSVTVTLMHTVDYGIWLETIQSGRFAIIMPTLEKYAAEIQKAVAEGVFSGG
jgi:hypothetical protein